MTYVEASWTAMNAEDPRTICASEVVLHVRSGSLHVRMGDRNYLANEGETITLPLTVKLDAS